MRPTFQIIRYYTAPFCFREWAQSALGVDDLALLHEQSAIVTEQPNDRWVRAKLNAALLRELPRLIPVLQQFVTSELALYFDGVPEVRHPPLFRIHLPGAESISPFHSDSEYGLVLGAINCWIPLTRVWGANSLWIESEPGREDYQPIELDYGEALIFDAVRLKHGTQDNRTESTRVSFDFRCHGRLRDLVPDAGLEARGGQPRRIPGL